MLGFYDRGPKWCSTTSRSPWRSRSARWRSPSPLHRDPQGLLPRAGHRRSAGRVRGGARRLLPGDDGRQRALAEIVPQDPDVAPVASFIGADGTNATVNSGRISITLKPRGERNASADADHRAPARRSSPQVEGIALYLQSVQDLQIDSRVSRTQYQYTLEDADADELAQWAPQLLDEAARAARAARRGQRSADRRAAARRWSSTATPPSRLGILAQAIDDTLYDAFGQRQVSTIFTQLNQYRVILEVRPEDQQNPSALERIYVRIRRRRRWCRSRRSPSFEHAPAPLVDQPPGPVPGHDPLVQPGARRLARPGGQRHRGAPARARLPPGVHAGFHGRRPGVPVDRSRSEPLLILAALITVYIVLGVLYESYIHPITILSTLPSAGVGALLALMLASTRVQRHRADRHRAPHRHREEERHHDDRLRARGRARPGPHPARGDLPGLPAALPPDHDDHHGRAARRPAARARHAAPAPSCAGPLGITIVGGPGHLAGAHPLHHAGRLPVHGAAAGASALEAAAQPGRAEVAGPSPSRQRHELLRALHPAARSRPRSWRWRYPLAGVVALRQLPVAPLPRVDFPTIIGAGGAAGRQPRDHGLRRWRPRSSGGFGRIAGLTEMTSSSALGIDPHHPAVRPRPRRRRGRARRAGGDQRRRRRPADATCPARPNFRKVNPADAPILILALHLRDHPARPGVRPSQHHPRAEDLAGGRGRAGVRRRRAAARGARAGRSGALAGRGLTLEDVRAAPGHGHGRPAQGRAPDGDAAHRRANDQLCDADDYKQLDRRLPERRAGAARATSPRVIDRRGEQPRWPPGWTASRAVLLIIRRQPGANIIETHRAHPALLPDAERRRSRRPSTSTSALDRSPDHPRLGAKTSSAPSCSASSLVVLVVFLFLRNGRATLIPSVAVPLSLLGTFGVMYLLGYSLDNLSLMALTISTGFVVDDAIVVTENVARYIEAASRRSRRPSRARGRSASPSSRSPSRCWRCSSPSC